ncbi:hypothetical protein [Halarcobacter bivalviorum]|uniref:Uncharacterized protein n=1 Tax=Halarcobacter bivalviorum TaxID=663364 RepID=A0AAX2ACC3_9BACT|nr:hypothetical protein [Halarcobacter bivalviorum]AXH12000.1 hypothetical protein ABIV_0994 [Halarcobacter bivalviorum]RXK11116.1 hypothetical protein CRV05_01745 [Halarcobacter bivalviorum]
MAKRCEDEFNPWPSFVDIFSSVILVMLLFLLVVLVNLGYYAQFKYKVSYTGTIATDDLIVNDNPSSGTTKLYQESQAQPNKNISMMQQEIIRLRKIVEEKVVKAKEKEESKIEHGGIDVADRDDSDKPSKQTLISTEDYYIVTFKGNEIFFDTAIIKELKTFIEDIKKKYKKHQILITAADVQGQASATVAKQISLARSIGARNLIRKFGYEKKDVRIDLLASTEIKEEIDKQNGYLVIRIKR